MPSPENPRSQPPETLEGWYALHQLFTVDRAEPARASDSRGAGATPAAGTSRASHSSDGWSAWARVIGSTVDVMAVHFAPTLDAIAEAQDAVRRSPAMDRLRLRSSFLSVTEAGLYHLTSELARETIERGGTIGDETYTEELARRVARERENSHVQRRLYPPLPEDMPYICFYPMSKRRAPEQNWYDLPLAERSDEEISLRHGTMDARRRCLVAQEGFASARICMRQRRGCAGGYGQ